MKKHPNFRQKVKVAHVGIEPASYLKKLVFSGLFLGLSLSAVLFFFFGAFEGNMLYLLFLIPLVMIFSVAFMMQAVDVRIKKRQREVDRDVLFAGRFILVKLQSGVPFFNAMVDASRGKDTAANYFKEIVANIEMGTPIEKALDEAIERCPSAKFRRILFQINNALRTGTDIGDSLKRILNHIAREQVIEIKEYGKKLNSLALFYMLIGVVIPALGMTMFIIIASFLSVNIGQGALAFVAFLLLFCQMLFISIFKSSRPAVNL